MLLIASTVLLSGCDSALLDPKGQIGLEQRSLILTVFGLMMTVAIPAALMAVGFAWKYRVSSKDAKYSPNWLHSNRAETVVWMVSVLIIPFLAVLTWKTTHALEPNKPLARDRKPIAIEIASMDWEWFSICLERGVATVNGIASPANIPVYFKVTSNSVMNSFLIPRLDSQIYAAVRTQTQLYLIADETGTYDGTSASYSDPGLSGMKFRAIITPDRTIFDQWVEKVKQLPNFMDSIAAFNKVAVSSEHNKVEYFSNVKPDLLKDVVNKSMSCESMNMSKPEGEHAAYDGMEGMDTSHAETVH